MNHFTNHLLDNGEAGFAHTGNLSCPSFWNHAAPHRRSRLGQLSPKAVETVRHCQENCRLDWKKNTKKVVYTESQHSLVYWQVSTLTQ